MTDAQYMERLTRIADEAQRNERRTERLESVLRALSAESFDSTDAREAAAGKARRELRNAQTLCEEVSVEKAASYLRACLWQQNVTLYVLHGVEVFR